MALDPNIALQVRGIELPNQLAQYGQVAAIQNAQNQNALAQYQLENAKRQDVAQNALNKAWSESIDPTTGKPDYNKLIGTLASSGAAQQIPAILKQQTEAQTAATTEAQHRAKLALDKTAMYRDMVGSIQTRDDAIKWLQTQMTDPDMAGTPVAKVPLMQAAANIPTDPTALDKWKQQHALGMTKYVELNKPHYITENLGGTSQISALPGLGGGPSVLSTTKKTATPGELMVDARAKERLAAETATGVLTPESLDLAANLYNQTGTLPPLGIGKGAANLKAQIMNKATQLSMGGATPASAADAATNLVTAKQDVASRSKAVKDFSTGKQGQQVNAFNTAIDHLGTMDKLSDALANGDVKAINALGNEVAKQTGAPAPTNFNAAKQIVTAEVIKAVVASGGGVTERQEAERNFSNANSPAQLKGVIDTYKQLLGGQLKSLNLQYENTTGRKDFEKKLTPDAKAALSKLRSAETPAVGGGGVDLSNPLLAK